MWSAWYKHSLGMLYTQKENMYKRKKNNCCLVEGKEKEHKKNEKGHKNI